MYIKVDILIVQKSKNLKNYPLQWSNDPKRVDSRTRSVQTESLTVMGNGPKMLSTFHSDSARIWNHSPDQIKNCKTLFAAKKAIKQFVKVSDMNTLVDSL